jgi:hypothetical protein
MNRVTRSNQKLDTIYVVADDRLSESIFVTPDGEGRFYYDSVEDAQDDMGPNLPVVYADEVDD